MWVCQPVDTQTSCVELPGQCLWTLNQFDTAASMTDRRWLKALSTVMELHMQQCMQHTHLSHPVYNQLHPRRKKHKRTATVMACRSSQGWYCSLRAYVCYMQMISEYLAVASPGFVAFTWKKFRCQKDLQSYTQMTNTTPIPRLRSLKSLSVRNISVTFQNPTFSIASTHYMGAERLEKISALEEIN